MRVWLYHPLFAVLCLCGAWAGLNDLLPDPWRAGVAVLALLWAPGAGWASQESDPLKRFIKTCIYAALISTISVIIARWTALEAPGLLATAATFGALGYVYPAVPLRKVSLWPLFLLIPLLLSQSDALQRPLDAYFYTADAEEDWEGQLPDPAAGWQGRVHPVEGAWRLRPTMARPMLLGPSSGELLLLLRGPVGAKMKVGEQSVTIQRDVVENVEEGAVPRYQDAGIAAIRVKADRDAGEQWPLSFSDPAHSTFYILANPEALWELHGNGELRFSHYYQLLNMVEQLRWAEELLQKRSVTDVQPPGWSYILAGPLAVGGGEMVAVHAVLAWVLALGMAVGLWLIRAWGGRGGGLFVGILAALHRKLVLEPGSAGLPDGLYAVALLGTVAALAKGQGSVWVLWSQLLRYPGLLVGGLAAMWAGQFRMALRSGALVIGTAALFGLYGWYTEQLSGWLQTVAWETGPEHWHGEHDPVVLMSRIPEFYGLWLQYSGGTPLLAALALTWQWRRGGGGLAQRGAKVCLGTALSYSFLLCTIDHQPSHYFLPLVYLSGLALVLADVGWLTAVGLVGGIYAYLYVPVV